MRKAVLFSSLLAMLVAVHTADRSIAQPELSSSQDPQLGIPHSITRSQCVSDSEHFDYGPHRVNVQAEFLAMIESHELRAPDAVYDRIVRDFALLDSTYPILTTVERRTVGMIGIAAKLDLNQLHNGFDDLNDFYQVVSVEVLPAIPQWRFLTFCDTINGSLLISEYIELPEVLIAEGGAVSGYDHSGDYIDLSIESDLYVYEFSNGENPECPMGCFCRQTWRFAVDLFGAITILGYDPGSCKCGDEGEWLPNQGDFDADGLMDCLDSCPLTIPGVDVDAQGCTPYTRGDFDDDGDVALDDFGRIQRCVGGPFEVAGDCPATRPSLDSDKDVDLEDIWVFLNCFRGTNELADPSCSR